MRPKRRIDPLHGLDRGVVTMEDQLGYGASKAALLHLTRMLAVQLGPYNIRVTR